MCSYCILRVYGVFVCGVKKVMCYHSVNSEGVYVCV